MAETFDPFKQSPAPSTTDCSGGRADEPCADPASHCIDLQNPTSVITEPRILPGDGTDVEAQRVGRNSRLRLGVTSMVSALTARLSGAHRSDMLLNHGAPNKAAKTLTVSWNEEMGTYTLSDDESGEMHGVDSILMSLVGAARREANLASKKGVTVTVMVIDKRGKIRKEYVARPLPR